MNQSAEPALTPEEWKQHEEIRNLYEGAEEWYRMLGTYNPKEMAARCLYAQPFGFTWDDIDALDQAISYDPTTGKLSMALESLRMRITALLPPRIP